MSLENFVLVTEFDAGPTPNYDCLVCSADVSDDGVTQQDSLQYLRIICEVLGLNEDEGTKILDKFGALHQIHFCKRCCLNLEMFRDIQLQLNQLNLQISIVRKTLTEDLCQNSSSMVKKSTSELRSCLANEFELRKGTSTIKPECILGQADAVDDSYSLHGSLDVDDDIRIGDDPIDDVVHQWNLKPCQVKIERITKAQDCGNPKNNQERRMKKRLKKLRERQGVVSLKDRKDRDREFKKNRPKSSKERISELKRKWKASVLPKEEPVDVSTPQRLRIKKERTRTLETCPVAGCTEQFSSSISMGYHLKQIHEGIEKAYNCIACSAEFVSHPELKKHIRNEHDGRKGAHPQRNVYCPTCHKGFLGYQDLTLHCRRQGGICTKDPLPLNSTVDALKKQVICGVCGKGFRRRYLLEMHVKGNHLGVHPFLCELCCKPFKREKSLKVHQRQMHPKEYMEAFNIDEQEFNDDLKGRYCEICNKTFANEQGKKNHDVLHSQQFEYYCATCGIGCTSKRTLIQHEVTHSTVREFPCTECAFRFNRIDKLRRHVKRVHATEDKKKGFKCPFCDKGFWDNYALLRHKRIMHRDTLPVEVAPEFECALCGYTCPDKGYLGIHFKTKKHRDRMALARTQLEMLS